MPDVPGPARPILPAKAEQGNLLPFKDHYVLEFLGLAAKHRVRQIEAGALCRIRHPSRSKHLWDWA